METVEKPINSTYSAYYDNISKAENEYYERLMNRFMDQTKDDSDYITVNGNDLLKSKFTQLQEIGKAGKNSMEKAVTVGEILTTVAKDILHSEENNIRQRGFNVILSYLNLAKETGDKQLIETANRIMQNMPV